MQVSREHLPNKTVQRIVLYDEDNGDNESLEQPVTR